MLEINSGINYPKENYIVISIADMGRTKPLLELMAFILC